MANADTEWNDALRNQGILPPKESDEGALTEDSVIAMVEETVNQKLHGGKDLPEMTLDELDELEDEEDERVLLEYRKRRIEEMMQSSQKAKYGDVREISAIDYVDEVNKAGEGIWVILHLYKQGIPLCALINQHLGLLATKFPATKFLKSISTTCIPNYPDRNLPTLFVYFEGDLKTQIVGPDKFGGINLTVDELEWMLSEAGAVKTTLDSNPRPKVQDVLFTSLKRSQGDERERDIYEDNDW